MTTVAGTEQSDDAKRKPPEPLPWLRTVALIVTIGFACGVIGWLIGRPSDPTFNDVDVGFLADMTEHHAVRSRSRSRTSPRVRTRRSRAWRARSSPISPRRSGR